VAVEARRLRVEQPKRGLRRSAEDLGAQNKETLSSSPLAVACADLQELCAPWADLWACSRIILQQT